MKFKVFFLFIFTYILTSCDKQEVKLMDYNRLEKIDIPSSFPDIIFPVGNEFTTERWALGKKLFFDKRLSVDSTLSCASCHKPTFGFADNVSLSDGVAHRPGTRNAPTLANVALHPYYTREGGLPTLEMQILVPIQEHNEFDFNIVLIVDRLKNDQSYQDLAMKSYGRSLDAFSITRAISNFERSIISGSSRYDKFLVGDVSQLTQEELQGRDLFFSDKTNCSACHGGINFTDYGLKNNGLYITYADSGRYRLTEKESDIGVFKTASLRNLGFTAPYMHDGSIQTLDAVIAHYNSGGKAHPNKSDKIKPLSLNSAEMKALKQFLLSLDDHHLITNKYLMQ